MQDTNEGPLSIHNTVLPSLHTKGVSMHFVIATRTGETADRVCTDVLHIGGL